jgi:hypothetical protein
MERRVRDAFWHPRYLPIRRRDAEEDEIESTASVSGGTV